MILDLEARPTDFQIEERFLRSAVDKFHARRYSQQYVSICVNTNVINYLLIIHNTVYRIMNLHQVIFQSIVLWGNLSSYLMNSSNIT